MTEESMVAPVSVGDTGNATQDASEKMIPERDFNRLRSKLESQKAQLKRERDIAHDQAQRANQARLQAEQQVQVIITKAEEQMMEKMTEEEKRDYEVKKLRRDNQRLQTVESQSSKQQKIDAWRDGVLRKYKLDGNEDGLDYSSRESFLETVISTRAANVLRDMRNKELRAQREQSSSVSTDASQNVARKTETVSEAPDRLRPPRVETRSGTGVATPNGTLDSETLADLQWEMVRGPVSGRKAAKEKLANLRA